MGGHGGDRKSEQIKFNNVNLEDTPKSQTGNSDTYALRKLRKDRPDLHGRVLAPGKPRTLPKTTNPHTHPTRIFLSHPVR